MFLILQTSNPFRDPGDYDRNMILPFQAFVQFCQQQQSWIRPSSSSVCACGAACVVNCSAINSLVWRSWCEGRYYISLAKMFFFILVKNQEHMCGTITKENVELRTYCH